MPFSGYPRAFFSLPVFGIAWIVRFSTPSFFPLQPRPFLTGYLGGQVSLFPVPQGLTVGTARFGILAPRSFTTLRGFYRPTVPLPLIWVAGSLFVPPYGWPAVFTAPRFLPPRGFYRSADFTAPLSPVLWGALLFHRPRACCPPVFPHFRAARSLCRLTVHLRFYRSAVFTAPRFLPLRGFYRSAIFTAPRFLPLRGFYRSAIFTAPRFLPLRDFFRSAFAGSLGGSTLPFCPPVFALFRAHPVLPAPP